MHDDITGIDQHPVAMGHTLDPWIAHAGFGEVIYDAVRNRAHVAVRSPRRHNHDIGNSGLSRKIDGDGVLGLHVVEARQDKT